MEPGRLSVVSSHLLQNDDLIKACSILESLRGRWKILGRCLGIQPSKLDSIDKGTCEDKLKEVLLTWLSYHEANVIYSNEADYDPGGCTPVDYIEVVSTVKKPLIPHFRWWQPSWKALSIALKSINEDLAIKIVQNNQCDCAECLDVACIRNTPVGLCVQDGDVIGAAKELYDNFNELLTGSHLKSIITPDKLRQCLASLMEHDGKTHVSSEHLLKEIEKPRYSTMIRIIDHLKRKSFVNYFNHSFLEIVIGYCTVPSNILEVAEYGKDHRCFFNLSFEKISMIFQDEENDELLFQPPEGLPVLTLHLESKWSKRSMYELMVLLEQHTHTHINPLKCFIFVKMLETSGHGFDITYAVWPSFISAIVGELKDLSTLTAHGVTIDPHALKLVSENANQDLHNNAVEIQFAEITDQSVSFQWKKPPNCELKEVAYRSSNSESWQTITTEATNEIVFINDLSPSQKYEIKIALIADSIHGANDIGAIRVFETAPSCSSFMPREAWQREETTSAGINHFNETLPLPFCTTSKKLKTCIKLSWTPPATSNSCDLALRQQARYKLKLKVGNHKWEKFHVNHTNANPFLFNTREAVMERTCHLFKWEESTAHALNHHERLHSSNPNNRPSACENGDCCLGILSFDKLDEPNVVTSNNYKVEISEFETDTDVQQGLLTMDNTTAHFKIKFGSVYRFYVIPSADEVYSSDIDDQSDTKASPISHYVSCTFKEKEIHCNHVELQWEVPEHIANKIEYYSIRYLCSTSNKWNYIPDTIFNTRYSIQNLAQSTEYAFWLQAAYCIYAGDSMPRHEKLAELSCTTIGITHLGPPGKPEHKWLLAGPGKSNEIVEIKWQKPSNDEPVQLYKLYARPSNSTQHSLMRECRENLVHIERFHFNPPEEKYVFEVIAKYSNDSFSEFSECSEKLSVKERPKVPGKPKAISCSSNSITLQWNPAKRFQISKYKVKYTESNSIRKNWQSIETSNGEIAINIENLKPETSYIFKVKAKCESHSDDYGPASDLSEPIKTNPPKCLPPTKLVVNSLTSKALKLTWNAPENISLNPVSYYTVYCSSELPMNDWCLCSRILKERTTAELRVDELKLIFGVNYRFKVHAYYKRVDHTEVSESEPSEPYKLPYPIPSPPENPMITDVDQESVLLKWNKPIDNCEYVKSYSVYKRTGTQSDFELHAKEIDTRELSLKVIGLTPSTSYQFQIEALNLDKQGGKKVESALVTTERKAPTAPGKPYMLQVTHNRVKINWEKPLKNPEMVSQYEVYYKKCKQEEWMPPKQTQSNNTEIEICNLDHSTEYTFKVRLITDNDCICKEPESKETAVTTKSALPSEPGKPKGETDSEGSITLTWARPEENFKDISHYEVKYHQEGDESNTIVTKTDGAEEQITITDDLCHNKGYYFSVKAVTKTGESSTHSLLSDLITNNKTLRAEKFLPFCKIIGNVGNCTLHLLPSVEEPISSSRYLKKWEIKLQNHHDGNLTSPSAAPNRGRYVVNKVLMLVGATGAGKSTLINAMINYIMRVEYDNPFRIKIIHEEADVSQTKSVTKLVSAYILHHESGFAIPYTLTIVDTPGFGDTAGIERDKEITQQIKEFFSIKDGITHLDGVGFVCKSSDVRLTPTQQYIFDSILGIFGNDVINNIFVMCTFGDGIEEPQVIKAAREVKIPVENYYEFNNSALYATKASSKVKSSWEMGVESFKIFFQRLEAVESVSLQLTKEVLQQRHNLEDMATELEEKIEQTMIMIDTLKKDIESLNQLQEQNEDSDGKIDVEETITKRVQLKGKLANNCLNCNMTCHYPCQYLFDANGCVVMESQKKGKMYCKECRCSSSDHKVVSSHRLVKYKTIVKKSFKEITEKYANTKKKMDTTQEAIEILKNEIDLKFDEVFDLVRQAKGCRETLDKIALLQSHFNDVEYIEMLIEAQGQEKREGYIKRIDQYKMLKVRAEIFEKTGEFSARRDKDGKRWWEKHFLK